MWDGKTITAKFYNQNYRSSPASSQNFYRNDQVVSENEQFKVGRKFFGIFSEIFQSFLELSMTFFEEWLFSEKLRFLLKFPTEF